MPRWTMGLTVLAIASSAAAQTPAHPDLNGVWSNGSLTALTRAPGVPLVASETDARARAQRLAQRLAADARPSDPTAGPLNPGVIAQPVDSYWNDSGDSLAKVKGQYRNSWIVDPADGQLPLTDAGRQRAREAPARSNTMTAAGPESLAPNDRCIIASRGSGGPGMLNNIYNTNYQIVQTPGVVTIVVEMIHDARIIPVFKDKAAAQAGHGPAVLQRWLGDSTAWWDDGTLVIETVNVNPQQGAFGPIFLSAQGRVTERLTRVSPKALFYEFTVEDPVNYTQAWRAEMTLTAQDQPIYEYACHEGNYAMRGILGGARSSEGKGAP